jgi:hypothetical protein
VSLRQARSRSDVALHRIEMVVLGLLILAVLIGVATVGYVESRIRQTFVESISIDPSSTLRPVVQLQRETLRLQLLVRDVVRGGPVNEDELRLRWDLMRSRLLVLTQDTVSTRLQAESRAQLAAIQADIAALDDDIDRMLGGLIAGSPIGPATNADQILGRVEQAINRITQIESNARTFSAARIAALIRVVRVGLVVAGVILAVLTTGLVLITRRAAKMRVQAAIRELETARAIQQDLLPRRLPPTNGLDVAWHFKAAAQTSGDFYDFLSLSPQRVCLVVADVTGHGMGAALIASGARQTLRSELFHHQDDLALALTQTNRWLHLDMPQRRFVAATCALFDTEAQRVTLANAGQMSPLLWRDGELRYLEPMGLRLPLGITGETGYATLEVPLEPGDLLVFYTDGIVEAQSASGELFGFERLEATIREGANDDARLVSERVVEAVAAFTAHDVPLDDITLVVVRAQAIASHQLDTHDPGDHKGTHVVA